MKNISVTNFYNRLQDVFENLRLLGAIDRKTEALINTRLFKIYSTLNKKYSPDSSLTRIEKKYREQMENILSGEPEYFGRYCVDLSDVIKLLIYRLECERNAVKKLMEKLTFGTEKEQLQMISGQLNKIASEVIVLADILFELDDSESYS